MQRLQPPRSLWTDSVHVRISEYSQLLDRILHVQHLLARPMVVLRLLLHGRIWSIMRMRQGMHLPEIPRFMLNAVPAGSELAYTSAAAVIGIIAALAQANTA